MNWNDSLKEELETWKQFLVDSEMENERRRVFNFAMDTLDPEYLLKKLDVVFDSLKCAAKLNLAFDFALKNVANESCWYYYPHEHITIWSIIAAI